MTPPHTPPAGGASGMSGDDGRRRAGIEPDRLDGCTASATGSTGRTAVTGAVSAFSESRRSADNQGLRLADEDEGPWLTTRAGVEGITSVAHKGADRVASRRQG